MPITTRRQRERAERHRRILDTARALAEAEGWSAVTTRRLAAEIEYSQPVLYSHFPSMEALRDAVAVEGFAELAGALGAGPPTVAAVAAAYVDFARRYPALYDAMFTLSSSLPFSAAHAPAPLREGFATLLAAVRPHAGATDPETLAETFWSALHGLATLERAHRLRADSSRQRLATLIDRFGAGRG